MTDLEKRLEKLNPAAIKYHLAAAFQLRHGREASELELRELSNALEGTARKTYMSAAEAVQKVFGGGLNQ